MPHGKRSQFAGSMPKRRIKTASLNAELANWRARRRTSSDEPVGLPQYPFNLPLSSLLRRLAFPGGSLTTPAQLRYDVRVTR
jgi:hypothetical protein